MIASYRNSLSFLMGVGLAFLPAYGPFIALLFFFGTRWQMRRSDLAWWLAALLLAVPLAVHQGPTGFFIGLLQILAPWLVYRAFSQFAAQSRVQPSTRLVGWGLIAGLTCVVAIGWLQIDALNVATAKTISQAIVWDGNPALYGHTVLALGALMAILLPDARLRIASLGLAALGILASGSREAAIGWVFIAVVLLFVDLRRSQRAQKVEIGLIAVMLMIAAGLGPLLGWGRVGFLVDLLPASHTANLLQGTEIAKGDWWDPLGVTFESGIASLNNTELTAYTVAKTLPEGWRRLQQVVSLERAAPYTVSVWIKRGGSDNRSGVMGWGPTPRDERDFVVTGRFEESEWTASVSGAGRLLEAGVLDHEGDWYRVFASFVYEGDEPNPSWWLGMTPDQRAGITEPARFAGLQLVQNETPGAYVPGSATKGLGLGAGRLPYWQAAWAGFVESPILGWGQAAFPSYYEQHWSTVGAFMQAIPSHVHNSYLQVLFDRGVVGLAGLALLVGVIAHHAFRMRDIAFLAALCAILVAGTFDTTLFYGGVLYPLVAVAGWRAVTYRQESSGRDDPSRHLATGLALPLTDYVMVGVAITLAAFGTSIVTSSNTSISFIASPDSWRALAYALLLWPAMYWREGLYPGYGLSGHAELKKQIQGGLYATLVLAAMSLFFAETLPLSGVLLLSTMLLSFVLVPVGRAIVKRILHKMTLYGRPVVILGTGKTAEQLARTLSQEPLIGLRPVAFFEENPEKRGETLEGLPIEGALTDAGAYAEERNIRHALVAVEHVSSEALSSVMGPTAGAFRQIQLIPDLHGLPLRDVAAGNLGDLLTLQVRNNLASSSNQLIKRLLDLVGAIIGGIVISPLVVILCVAIYATSPGPIFYAQRRIGRGGKPFNTWKFRTMVPHAEETLQVHLSQDPEAMAEWNRTFKLKHDPRITPVGSFLRKTSLDELPQLFNVLRGQMSLVGPRPLPEYHHHALSEPARRLREMVMPGMTGQWQVTSRSDGDLRDLERHDTYYVRNWSVWLDLHLLVRTIGVIFRGKGAY